MSNLGFLQYLQRTVGAIDAGTKQTERADKPVGHRSQHAKYEAFMKGKGWLETTEIAVAIGKTRAAVSSSLRNTLEPRGLVEGREKKGKPPRTSLTEWRWKD